jgi:hypothetical protein
MRTPEQKRAAVERLLAVWLRLPDERLGQLLLNACPAGFFYAEDEALLNALESRVRGTPVQAWCGECDSTGPVGEKCVTCAAAL